MDVKLDPTTVKALYDEHSASLGQFLRGLLRDEQLAADCLQNVFTKAIEQGHSTAEKSRRAWLYRVAYHEAMLLHRRRGIDARAKDRIADEIAAGSSAEQLSAGQAESSESIAVRRESIDRVRQALNQLSAGQRQLIELKIFEGKTFAQIASELSIPLGTALTRMRSTLVALRKLLGEEDVAE